MVVSFRSPRSQATRVVSQMSAHGHSRAETRGQADIASVGTSRSYAQTYRQFAAYLQANRAGDLWRASAAQAQHWLAQRAKQVGQKTLDQNRQALQALYSYRGVAVRFEKADYRSQRPTHGLAQQQRYYSPEQIRAIADHQSPRNRLATHIAAEAGLRAAELPTIARPDEQPPSARHWRSDRHTGRESAVAYTVRGKGGLVREVRVSAATARLLEAVRRTEPVTITDRGVHRVSRYAIGGGNAWSRSFTDASRRVCGFSLGAHGLRHTYAHERQEALQGRGYRYDDARAIVAQEVGHWNAATTQSYLR